VSHAIWPCLVKSAPGLKYSAFLLLQVRFIMRVEQCAVFHMVYVVKLFGTSECPSVNSSIITSNLKVLLKHQTALDASPCQLQFPFWSLCNTEKEVV
jgi:hypothetical protein